MNKLDLFQEGCSKPNTIDNSSLTGKQSRKHSQNSKKFIENITGEGFKSIK